MKLNSIFIHLLLLATIAGCGSSGGGSAPNTLISIVVSPINQSIALGTTQQFSARGIFSDNSTQDLTSSANWSSSVTSVANISNSAGSNGKATSVATGTTSITATSGGVTGTATLTVTSATLVSLAISPTNPSIPLRATLQFNAKGTFSDNSTQDLTTTANWSSSVTSIATISNTIGSNGKATPVASGTTIITATVPVTQPVPGSISGSTSLTVTGGGDGQTNVLPITVNGSLCSSGSYPNKPCVSVTICTPGTSNCQLVTDLLLDTGSYGLRIFKQALSVSLSQITVGSRSLAECVQFGDGSSEWGPVQMASVILGNEPAVQVPIHVIDITFGTRSMACINADTSPSTAGFNGILGVGLFSQDCGTLCTFSSNNGIYSTCSGSSCSGSTVPLASQVQNPVALLPVDNGGVLVQLPSVSLGGVPSINGSLVLGIGTKSNNTPSAETTYPANSVGEFTTIFNGVSFTTSFIDSGSNGLYFTAPASLLPSCPSPNSGFYCPAATISLSATNTGAFGTPSGPVPFQIGNFSSLVSTSNNVFREIGGTGPDGIGSGGFDWGLPFFLGRNVFVGIEGTRSSLGTGPYWAY